jgi:hypothetical protein
MSESEVRAPETVEAMRARARALLDSLGWWQRRRVTIDFADRDERARWYYTPNPRRGLALNQMRPRQQQRALQLLASGLSEAGFNAASVTMSLENVLDRHEGWRGPRTLRSGRDPMRYAVAIFGDPLGPTWGWRFEGHHLSVRYVVDGDCVRCTPLFIGGHPARSPLPGGAMLDSPLTPAVLAVQLLGLLSEEERERAVVSPVAPVDILSSNRSLVEGGSGPRTPSEMMAGRPDGWRRELRAELGLAAELDEAPRLPAEPDGVAFDAVGHEAQHAMRGLIQHFVCQAADEVASAYEARIVAGGSPSFAWAGATDGRAASYFRIRNRSLLIEFDNAQDHANHVHAVWRDLAGDFGRDLLGEQPTEVGPRHRSLAERVVGRVQRMLE